MVMCLENGSLENGIHRCTELSDDDSVYGCGPRTCPPRRWWCRPQRPLELVRRGLAVWRLRTPLCPVDGVTCLNVDRLHAECGCPWCLCSGHCCRVRSGEHAWCGLPSAMEESDGLCTLPTHVSCQACSWQTPPQTRRTRCASRLWLLLLRSRSL